jgi:hypothetical protein
MSISSSLLPYSTKSFDIIYSSISARPCPQQNIYGLSRKSLFLGFSRFTSGHVVHGRMADLHKSVQFVYTCCQVNNTPETRWRLVIRSVVVYEQTCGTSYSYCLAFQMKKCFLFRYGDLRPALSSKSLHFFAKLYF